MIESIMSKKYLKASNLVKLEREKRGWTQSHLSEVAGLSERTIQRLEKDGVAGKESLLALASVLDIEVEKLTEQEPVKKPEHVLVNFELILTGKDALDLIWHADAYEFDYFGAEGEAGRAIAALFEFLQDAGELSRDVGFADKIEWTEALTAMVKGLSEHSLLAFGRRNKTKVTHTNGVSTELAIATIYAVPFYHPGIFLENDKLFLKVQVPTKTEFVF